MIASESFNTITRKIEEIIESRPREYQGDALDIKKIGRDAFDAGECAYIDERSKNEIFKFITGMTLNQYINQRLMMYAYKVLLEQDEYNISEMINILGLSGEPALYKKFKDAFNMTPREAFDRKIWSLYVKPSSWETTSDEGQKMFIKTVEVIKEVPVEVIKEIKIPIRNKRAIIVSIIAIAFALIGVMAYKRLSNIYNTWDGDYQLCVSAKKGTESCMRIAENWAISIDVFNQCAKLNIDGVSQKFNILYVSNNAIKIQAIGADYIISGKKKDNGFGYFELDNSRLRNEEYGLDNCYLIAVRNSAMEEIKEKWNGTYTLEGNYSDSQNIYNELAYFISVDLNHGYSKYCFKNDEGKIIIGIGDILYFDQQKLKFAMDSHQEDICVCESLGESGFKIQFPKSFEFTNDMSLKLKCNKISDIDIITEIEKENQALE